MLKNPETLKPIPSVTIKPRATLVSTTPGAPRIPTPVLAQVTSSAQWSTSVPAPRKLKPFSGMAREALADRGVTACLRIGLAIAAVALMASLFAPKAEASARLKDVASIKGMRENQLIGYGLV